MSTKEVTVNNQTVINVVLEMETVGLEEVVAVGYGTQSKKTLTGAISSIKSDEILTTKSTDFVSKLQGKVAGLNIRQNTGEPGTFDHVINIRGFGSPLYIIDGVERPSGDFQRLTSDDIENITILKDASAAIYGLNAANGVVLITTKTGVDKETTFQFSSNFGFSKPTSTVPMTNAYEWNLLRNEAEINFGYEPLMSFEELEKWRKGDVGYESTDWRKETFKNYSSMEEFNLSAQGGSEKVSYYLNGNVQHNGGMLKSGDMNYRKLGLRSNITRIIHDKVINNGCKVLSLK